MSLIILAYTERMAKTSLHCLGSR